MSEKKTKRENEALLSEKEDKVELRKPAQAEFEVTLTDDSAVQNGFIESAEKTIENTSYTTWVHINDDEALQQWVESCGEIYQSYFENSGITNEDLESIKNNPEALKDFLENMPSVPPVPKPLFSKEYKSDDYFDRKDLKGIDLVDLRNVYLANGNSAEKTYQYLKDYITENKNNPEVLQKTVSRLLDNFVGMYDSNVEHKKVGENQTDILNKIINVPEDGELSGFICGSIHSFVMNALNDCGINAALLTGASIGGGNHATLLYQLKDGQYIFNDYGTNVVIEASNIKDAMREISKKSNSLESAGYLTLQTDGGNSYQEFAFEKEAAFGEEMDKRDYHSQTPFDIDMPVTPSVSGNLELSTNGNISAQAGGSLVYGNSVKNTETALTLGFKKNNETAMFMNSQSAGLKLEHKGLNTDTGYSFDVKGIMSYTKGTLGGCKYTIDSTAELKAENRMIKQIRSDLQQAGFDNEKIDSTIRNPYLPEELGSIALIEHTKFNYQPEFLSTFINASATKKSTLLKTDNMELTNAIKASGYGGLTVRLNEEGSNGDIRLMAEDGLALKNTFKDCSLSNVISGGILADLKQRNTGWNFLQPGVKFNAATSVAYSSNPNFGISAGAKVSSVVTPVDKDLGVEGSVQAVYKPENSKVVLHGEAQAGLYKQRLTIGGFNEQTENTKNFSVALGAQLNPRTSVSLRYNNERHALNKTRNNSSVTIGTRVTF